MDQIVRTWAPTVAAGPESGLQLRPVGLSLVVRPSAGSARSAATEAEGVATNHPVRRDTTGTTGAISRDLAVVVDPSGSTWPLPGPSLTVQGLTYRWYSDHRLLSEHRRSTITAQVHGNADDAERKVNRTENVRSVHEQ